MKNSGLRGFTLLEMMIVVVIAGVLVSLAMISIADYMRSIKLRTTLYSIDAHIRQAHWVARSTSTTCFIKFDAAANSYTINEIEHAILPDGVKFGVAPGVTGCPGDPYMSPPDDGISFDSPGHPNILNYYPTGAVVPAGTVYITDGNQTMAVRVARTGRPKLWRSSGGTKWTAI